MWNFKIFAKHKDYIAYNDYYKNDLESYVYVDDEHVHYYKCINENNYLTFKPLESSTFAFTNPINYSTDDGETWTLLSANTNTPTINARSKIMFKATLIPSFSNGIGTFSSTGEFNVSGNVMSLLYGDNFIGQVDLTKKKYAFYYLFKDCTKLINTKNLSLPATTLATSCYNGMFYGCTSLITAPALPATTLAENCYSFMFRGCSSLTTAPTLPATTLADYCYSNMFSGCTSLTTAPELPATTLVTWCYGSMFSGCRSLNSITMLATNISASNCLTNWVFRVSTSGTFIKDPSMTSLPSGANGIPSGWTVQNATV